MMKNTTRRSQRGFTLIEMVVSMLVLGIAATAIITLNSNLFYRLTDVRDLQTGTQLLQACAEKVMATRRRSGFSAVFECDEMSNFDGFDVPKISTQTVTGTSAITDSCPVNVQCKQVVITVKKNNISFTSVTLQMMNF
ncbi:prepilin-type N-terminal cleavage/methylation domain-containing protein [Limnohabitans sp. JirII-31]|uniref:type IV pilus modification PilV family protein n=1 Tax=Limnohabitans sp. JirII-31 TaxID=1977908 RepID=UPI0013047784|nr:type II secretion system protein [Limnohabitans sp. JirII-31]